MTAFLNHEATPEKLLWCTVIHQAVRDLGHPNSNEHAKQTLRPMHNPNFASAMQLVFSGKEDSHVAWEYSGLCPKTIRADVIQKMRDGITVGQVGSRDTPMGPIDYKEVRRLVLRAFDQADEHYRNREESALTEMFARDCWMDVMALLGDTRRWGTEL